MHLTHEASKATLIQFILLGLLNIASAIDSILENCFHTGGQCVSNLLSSAVLYMLLVGWFAVILALGYKAQEDRSKRAANMLVIAELIVLGAALFNLHLDARQFSGYLSLVTSVLDVLISVWVIRLALKLRRAGGGRVVSKNRARQRRTPTQL